MDNSSDAPAIRNAFGTELRRFREQRHLSQSGLAKILQYHASYISKIEAGRYIPSEDFAQRADEVLNAAGALMQSWLGYPDRRRSSVAEARRHVGDIGDSWLDITRQGAPPGQPIQPAASASSLRVVNELATLRYTEVHLCEISVLREIKNVGRGPINAFPFRIHVDGFPGDQEKSREFHRAHPLRWQELDFRSWYGESAAGLDQPGAIELDCDPRQTDSDKIIEGWVLFKAKHYDETLPLYPNAHMIFKYSYTVTAALWGFWYQRHVRVPTDRIATELDFPSSLKPRLWGKESTLENPILTPLKSTINRSEADGRTMWSWAIDQPAMDDRYRFEWYFPD